ncbi:MAG: hypothetical protein Q8K55_15660 [Gemmatimonadaceae bacterium]|nr:hypothetical protein [Gemmatimonadaceae bacterium]
MMGIGVQDVIVAVLVVVALAFLVRRRRQRKQPKPEIVTLGRAPKRGATPEGPVGGA